MEDLSPDDTEFGPDRVYTYIGMQLRALRIGKGVTQATTAKVIGVSPQQYQKYEDGSSKCSLSYLMELAAYFGTSLSDLLPREATVRADLNEADLLARLVATFSSFPTKSEKLWLVEHLESILAMKQRSERLE